MRPRIWGRPVHRRRGRVDASFCGTRLGLARGSRPDETRGRHRHGHRLVHRQQCRGGDAIPARREVRHRRGGGLYAAGLPLPGAWQPQDRSGCDGGPPRPPLPGRRRRLLLGGDEPGHRRCRPERKGHLQSAHRPDRGLGRALAPRPSSPPPTSPAIPPRAPSASGPSRCPRRCRPPARPIFRPGSRPRA